MATKENLMRGNKIAQWIDHTLLKPTATPNDIETLCREALEWSFFSVCIPSCYVSQSAALVKGTKVKVCTVVGFPLGNNSSLAKAEETRVAIANGAHEIDMVINLGWLKAGRWDAVKNDIEQVVQSTKSQIVKVILETCYLTDEEITKGCEITMAAGAHFVKTSTGFGSAGATEEHVRLMRKTVGSNFGVKASGGIRDLASFQKMLNAGANRIGCSSGIQILKGQTGKGY